MAATLSRRRWVTLDLRPQVICVSLHVSSTKHVMVLFGLPSSVFIPGAQIYVVLSPSLTPSSTRSELWTSGGSEQITSVRCRRYPTWIVGDYHMKTCMYWLTKTVLVQISILNTKKLIFKFCFATGAMYWMLLSQLSRMIFMSWNHDRINTDIVFYRLKG